MDDLTTEFCQQLRISKGLSPFEEVPGEDSYDHLLFISLILQNHKAGRISEGKAISLMQKLMWEARDC